MRDSDISELIQNLCGSDYQTRKGAAAQLRHHYRTEEPEKIANNLSSFIRLFDRDPNEVGVRAVRDALITTANMGYRSEVKREILSNLRQSDNLNVWDNGTRVLTEMRPWLSSDVIQDLAANRKWVTHMPISGIIKQGIYYRMLISDTDDDEFLSKFEQRLENREKDASEFLDALFQVIFKLGEAPSREKLSRIVYPHLLNTEKNYRGFEDTQYTRHEEAWIVSVFLSHLPEEKYPIEERKISTTLRGALRDEIRNRLKGDLVADEEIDMCLWYGLNALGKRHVDKLKEDSRSHSDENIREAAESVINTVESVTGSFWTKDKIMKVNPYEFEELLSELWEEMGYETYRTARSNDRGVDVVAEGGNKIAIQAKRHQGNIGSPKVREMVGSTQVKNADEGILVTTSGFTKDAEQTAGEIENVRLIDGDELVDMLREHQIPSHKYV
jgi:hypothetical protein